MHNKFEFKPVEKTFSDPIAAVFKPGIPFGREYARGDIVLLHPEISSSKIFLNSKVLREALLDSKEYLEGVLNITITDNVKKPAKKKKKEPAVEAVEEEVPEIDVDTEEAIKEAGIETLD